MRTFASSVLARTVALTPVGRAYTVAAAGDRTLDFSTRALAALDVTAETSGEELDRVPSTGPVVVVANHPFGMLDGLLTIAVLSRVRSDVKLLGNSLLRHIPDLQPNLIPVDVFGSRRSVQRNSTAVRTAMRWLDRAGCVLVFPAGEVAHRSGCHDRTVDLPWHPAVAELAKRAGAIVVPVFIEGRNSRLFQAAGRIHPLLRTALLPHEMWAMRGRQIRVAVGSPVLATELAMLGDGRASINLLRARVDALASAADGRRLAVARMRPAPIAGRESPERLAANIDALQSEALLESGSYQVFCASAIDLPAVLPEIGRLREVTFRHAGEGTGRGRDLDRFDETYRHLFVWDRKRKEVAGAYRLGATDVVAPGGRVEGLYTRTLFDYDAKLLDEIGPALELGRAFVQPEYQRDFSPLLLLWKGISRLVARSGRYRRLFGVVSISDRYNSTSRELLVRFLQTRCFDADLGRLVRAKNPPPLIQSGPLESTTINSVQDVSSRIRRSEPDGKDMPVLLRQYLKLNAKLLGFTVDRDFGNVIDGFVLVDLADVQPAILSRYMGGAEAAALVRSR
jgi:putative hemolysin